MCTCIKFGRFYMKLNKYFTSLFMKPGANCNIRVEGAGRGTFNIGKNFYNRAFSNHERVCSMSYLCLNHIFSNLLIWFMIFLLIIKLHKTKQNSYLQYTQYKWIIYKSSSQKYCDKVRFELLDSVKWCILSNLLQVVKL